MKMRIDGYIEEQNTWKREPENPQIHFENPQSCWAGWSLMIISPLLPDIVLTLSIPVPPPSPVPPLFNCTYNYGDVRQMWPPWLICAFKQIIMHEQHDLKELNKPVRVASAAHSANEILLGGTLWGYPALLSCWIASHHGATLLATVWRWLW